MNNLIREVTERIKKLCSLREPPFELPADSFIDKVSQQIILDIFKAWQWINIADAIPEIGEQAAPFNWSRPVLCVDIHKQIHIACLTDIGHWRNFEGNYMILNESITHWMPLPEVP